MALPDGHHGWRTLRERFPGTTRSTRIGRPLAADTFLFVVIAWVFFRATSLDAALRILQGMFSLQELVLPIEWQPALAAWLPADSGTVRFGPSRCLWRDSPAGMDRSAAAMAWTARTRKHSYVVFARCRPCKREAGGWAWFSLGFIAVLVGLLPSSTATRGVSSSYTSNFLTCASALKVDVARCRSADGIDPLEGVSDCCRYRWGFNRTEQFERWPLEAYQPGQRTRTPSRGSS